MTGGIANILTQALHRIRTDVSELERCRYVKSTKSRSRSSVKKRWNRDEIIRLAAAVTLMTCVSSMTITFCPLSNTFVFKTVDV